METIDVSLIPEPIFFGFMGEVEALPLRKRAKWRAFIQDTNGVKHRVHFVNGELVFKNQSKWIALKPLGDQHLNDIVGYDDPRTEEHHRRLNRAYERGGIVEVQEEHDRLVNEAATGNHRSKPHKVKVPTRPGEPVRG